MTHIHHHTSNWTEYKPLIPTAYMFKSLNLHTLFNSIVQYIMQSINGLVSNQIICWTRLLLILIQFNPFHTSTVHFLSHQLIEFHWILVFDTNQCWNTRSYAAPDGCEYPSSVNVRYEPGISSTEVLSTNPFNYVIIVPTNFENEYTWVRETSATNLSNPTSPAWKHTAATNI